MFEEITLSFKNAKDVVLPRRITEELEGVRLETWPGYPQGNANLILSQLIPDDSNTAPNNMRKSFLIKKGHLVDKLKGKGLNFSKEWIEKNILGNYIRVTEDCTKQWAKAIVKNYRFFNFPLYLEASLPSKVESNY